MIKVLTMFGVGIVLNLLEFFVLDVFNPLVTFGTLIICIIIGFIMEINDSAKKRGDYV